MKPVMKDSMYKIMKKMGGKEILQLSTASRTEANDRLRTLRASLHSRLEASPSGSPPLPLGQSS